MLIAQDCVAVCLYVLYNDVRVNYERSVFEKLTSCYAGRKRDQRDCSILSLKEKGSCLRNVKDATFKRKPEDGYSLWARCFFDVLGQTRRR